LNKGKQTVIKHLDLRLNNTKSDTHFDIRINKNTINSKSKKDKKQELNFISLNPDKNNLNNDLNLNLHSKLETKKLIPFVEIISQDFPQNIKDDHKEVKLIKSSKKSRKDSQSLIFPTHSSTNLKDPNIKYLSDVNSNEMSDGK